MRQESPRTEPDFSHCLEKEDINSEALPKHCVGVSFGCGLGADITSQCRIQWDSVTIYEFTFLNWCAVSLSPPQSPLASPSQLLLLIIVSVQCSICHRGEKSGVAESIC